MRETGSSRSSAPMSGLALPTASSLHPNDIACLLEESNTHINGLEHRVQTIVVRRGQRELSFSRDMGFSSNFPDVTELIIVADGEEDTVDMVMEDADAMRESNTAKAALEELVGESTLIEDFLNQEEENVKRLLNKSQFSNADGKMTQRTGVHPKK